jgi:hypothetical protein
MLEIQCRASAFIANQLVELFHSSFILQIVVTLLYFERQFLESILRISETTSKVRVSGTYISLKSALRIRCKK